MKTYSVIVPFARPILLPRSWLTLLMSELLSATMWVAAQIMELTATAENGTPLSRPIRNGVGAVALISIAPAIIASRPSLPRKNFLEPLRQGYFKQAGLEVESRKFFLGKEGRDVGRAHDRRMNAEPNLERPG